MVNCAIELSLQERINYLAGTHLPSETMELRQMVDAALRRADEHILGADFMNDQGIERAPGQYPVNNPTFTRDRHLLKTSAGGNGRRLVLGAGSFRARNEDRQWQAFFSGGCRQRSKCKQKYRE